MHDDKRKQPFPRDRKGEIFQDDLGEDQSTAFPPMRDDAAHGLNLDPDQVDSQEADEFMKREKPSSETLREQARK
jgi:hypothetical protein